MSPKKRRGGSRGRGRGVAKRRGPKPRQPLSPDTATADDTDAEGMSTDGNVSFKQVISPPESPTRKKHAEYNEERELSLPRLKPTVIPENSTFLSMLGRDNKSDYIMTDDELDHVQWDLEAMLTNVIVRRNTIRDELGTFASMQFARSLHRMAKNPKLPTIRPRAAAEISPVNECRKMKVEFDPTSKELPPSKTESANKFWSLVEPYLAHVKKEDLKWLDDLVKSYSPSKKLYEIPPLGEHYAKNWAKEELEMQKNQSSCSPRPPKKLKFAERIAPDVVELVDKANSAINDSNVYTPVYQRVVTALLDHSNNMSLEDAEEHFPEYDDIEEKPQEMSNVCKEFYAEQNVKKQLYKLGLMGRNSKPTTTPEELLPSLTIADEENDEVLEELVKCDNALAQLREMNKNHLTQLFGRCRKDYYQQIIKNKIEKVNDEILNFKTQQNESWTKEKKIAQMSEEDDELHFLLNQRGTYIGQLQTVASESSNFLSPSVSDDSESSDEECEPSNVHIKTEPSENDTSIKMNILINDESQAEEDVEINIKHEIINERMDFEESNENDKSIECDEHVGNEEVYSEEIKKIVNEENVTEKDNDGTINQVDQTELQTNVKVNPLVKINEEENSSEKFTIKQQRRKPKKDILETEQTSKIESRKPIKIKQEPADYELELDPSEDIIDGVKRELRPRKLNEPHIYFEPYDGSTSEGSDFTDLSD